MGTITYVIGLILCLALFLLLSRIANAAAYRKDKGYSWRSEFQNKHPHAILYPVSVMFALVWFITLPVVISVMFISFVLKFLKVKARIKAVDARIENVVNKIVDQLQGDK